MSDENNDPIIDLSQVFLPDWAKESPGKRRYLSTEGDPDSTHSKKRGPNTGPRRPQGDRRSGPPSRDNRGRQDGGGGGNRGPRNDHRGDRGDRRGGDRRDNRRGGDRREAPPEIPSPDVDVSLVAETAGVQSIAKQIRLTGRAYPLFDIAHLIVKSSTRFHFRYNVQKKDGKVIQPLYTCTLDDTLHTNKEEAFGYLLDQHRDTFYKAEKIPTDPPKGTYTLVAQCGMSDEILGPPNYHDYQTKLAKLHQRSFAKMNFEQFKSRVKMVRDEEVIAKWVESQSFKTEYVCLNVPEEIRLSTMEEVEKHFRETHFAQLVKEVSSHTLSGKEGLNQPHRGLRSISHRFLNDQRRFPIKVVHGLSQQFAGIGLQFFKIKKTVTFVAVARPRYLNLDATPVSDGVRMIIEFVRANKKCARPQLMEELAPQDKSDTEIIKAPTSPTAEDSKTEATSTEETAPAPTPVPVEIKLTKEELEVRNNLHWLIHEGHIVEFANGELFSPDKPGPRPEPRKKVKKKQGNKPKAPAAGATPTEAKDKTQDAAAIPNETSGTKPIESPVAEQEIPKAETSPEASTGSEKSPTTEITADAPISTPTEEIATTEAPEKAPATPEPVAAIESPAPTPEKPTAPEPSLDTTSTEPGTSGP
ncbi:hypothetical protein N9059_01270 [bacterium]|nr:hypothetical protein [bacterium]